MAFPKCPRSECNNGYFQMSELKVSGANHRYNAISCTKCGAVVGVKDYLNVASVLSQIAEKLGIR